VANASNLNPRDALLRTFNLTGGYGFAAPAAKAGIQVFNG
jgi:hypothetical protein